MNTLLFFLVALALGTANPIGPDMPSRYESIRTAIYNNVQWLLRNIRNGSFEGPDLARAVVALFLAEPGLFSPGHEPGQELRDRIRTALTELIRQAKIRAEASRSRTYWSEGNTAISFIPSEELAWFLQAILVSCEDPYSFQGYDLTDGLYKSVIRHHCNSGDCVFPPPTMLALCNARAVSQRDIQDFSYDAIDSYGGLSSFWKLADEEAFLTMTFGCLKSSFYPYPEDVPTDIRLQYPLYRPSSGYRHYPSNLTVKDFTKVFTKPDGDNMVTGTVWSLSDIAAAMQNLMFNHPLRVSDLPRAVDILLWSQDEDGSWGQSTLNSLFILPVLSNKSFLNITSEHCPVGREIESQEKERRVTLTILVGDRIESVWYFYIASSFTVYNALTSNIFKSKNAIYHNGTDGELHLASLIDKENNPETGYFWFTYEQTRWPKESFTLLNQSHTDINIFKPSSRFMLWYRRKSEEEIENDQNGIQAGSGMES